MRFLLDAQLPPALCHWLQGSGHECLAVRDVDLRDATDAEIWSYAKDHQWTILTKDEDFAWRVRQAAHGPCVVWLRIGNASNAALTSWLSALLPGIVAALESGDRLVEVR